MSRPFAAGELERVDDVGLVLVAVPGVDGDEPEPQELHRQPVAVGDVRHVGGLDTHQHHLLVDDVVVLGVLARSAGGTVSSDGVRKTAVPDTRSGRSSIMRLM